MTAAPPPPKELAATLRNVAAILDQHGTRALDMAAELAARGWPASTIGNGSRSSSEYTSVESAVVQPVADLKQPDVTPNIDWNDVDTKLAACLHRTWVDSLDLRTLIANIVSHAQPDDRRTADQAGSGDCFACTRFVSGTANDRLRAGYCDACRMAWERAGRPDRVQFQRARRRQLDAERQVS